MRTPADLSTLPRTQADPLGAALTGDPSALLGSLAATPPAERTALRDRGVQLAALDGFAPTSGFDCRGRAAPVPGMLCQQGPNIFMQDGWHWTMPRK